MNLLSATERWLTALIVAFIEERFPNKRSTWEMIIEKSRDWLSDDPLIMEAKRSLE